MSSKDNKKHMSAAKDTKGTVKRLLGYLGAYKVRFIFVISASRFLPELLHIQRCLFRD